jgi:hypothetical protein
MEGNMPNDAVAIAVYDPPRPHLPYLAVVIYPDGEVTGIAAETSAVAQNAVEELATQVGAKRSGE